MQVRNVIYAAIHTRDICSYTYTRNFGANASHRRGTIVCSVDKTGPAASRMESQTLDATALYRGYCIHLFPNLKVTNFLLIIYFNKCYKVIIIK